jgi:hypothetical protein
MVADVKVVARGLGLVKLRQLQKLRRRKWFGEDLGRRVRQNSDLVVRSENECLTCGQTEVLAMQNCSSRCVKERFYVIGCQQC